MKVKGQEITDIYAYQKRDNYLFLNIGDKVCKISMETLLKMVNEFEFEVVEKRKWDHLENPELIDDYDYIGDGIVMDENN